MDSRDPRDLPVPSETLVPQAYQAVQEPRERRVLLDRRGQWVYRDLAGTAVTPDLRERRDPPDLTAFPEVTERKEPMVSPALVVLQGSLDLEVLQVLAEVRVNWVQKEQRASQGTWGTRDLLDREAPQEPREREAFRDHPGRRADGDKGVWLES